jgi:hypothetical protein
MPAISIALKADGSGGFDFKNDTGSDIPSGELFRQGNLVGRVTSSPNVSSLTPVSDTLVAGDIGHFELPGCLPIYRAPITPGAAYGVGELVSVKDGVVVPLGTVGETLVPLVTVGRAGPIDGASGSAGIEAANGAAEDDDTWVRVVQLPNAEALLV